MLTLVFCKRKHNTMQTASAPGTYVYLHPWAFCGAHPPKALAVNSLYLDIEERARINLQGRDMTAMKRETESILIFRFFIHYLDPGLLVYKLGEALLVLFLGQDPLFLLPTPRGEKKKKKRQGERELYIHSCMDFIEKYIISSKRQ